MPNLKVLPAALPNNPVLPEFLLSTLSTIQQNREPNLKTQDSH